MRDAIRYYGRLLWTALPGSLSAGSTWTWVALGLGLPLAIWLFGEEGGLSADVTFLLSWSALATVVALRLLWAPFVMSKADRETARTLSEELKWLTDDRRKANALCDVRDSAIERMNIPLGLAQK